MSSSAMIEMSRSRWTIVGHATRQYIHRGGLRDSQHGLTFIIFVAHRDWFDDLVVDDLPGRDRISSPSE